MRKWRTELKDRAVAENEFLPLGFSNRVITALMSAGIITVSHLNSINERELTLKKGIGPETAKNIRLHLNHSESVEKWKDHRQVVHVIFDVDTVVAIDRWAAKQGGPQNRSAAVRHLVQLALKFGSSGDVLQNQS